EPHAAGRRCREGALHRRRDRRRLPRRVRRLPGPRMALSTRPLRILVAKAGLDGHDRGAKIIARALRDAGFEIIYTGVHQTPEMIAETAMQEDVDAVGLSILSGAHVTLLPAVVEELKRRGSGDVLLFGGCIVPDEVLAPLTAAGVARYDASLGLTVASHAGLASGHIDLFASEMLRRRYLPRLARGEWLAAWCLTEAGSGSDAGGLRTRAVRDADGWLLNGSKMFITQGTVGHVYVVLASTAPDLGHRGISAFVVEKGTPGLGTGRKIEKLGLRSSDTAEVVLDNVRLAPGQLIGEENRGYKQALRVL